MGERTEEQKREFGIQAAEWHVRRANGIDEPEPEGLNAGDGDVNPDPRSFVMHHLGTALMIANLFNLESIAGIPVAEIRTQRNKLRDVS